MPEKGICELWVVSPRKEQKEIISKIYGSNREQREQPNIDSKSIFKNKIAYWLKSRILAAST